MALPDSRRLHMINSRQQLPRTPMVVDGDQLPDNAPECVTIALYRAGFLVETIPTIARMSP